MKDAAKLYLGFDLGASSLKWGYGNTEQGIGRFESLPLKKRDLAGLKALFIEVLQTVESDIGLKAFSGIGIGTPGTIDRASGKIIGVNPNLPFWTELSPTVLIPSGFEIPVFFDNDANLMCLGESSFYQKFKYIVGITVGSGIGCGYICDGALYHGAHGYAMEFGHATVVTDGVPCNCGRKGCLEAYASVDGIKRRVQLFSQYPDTKDWDLSTLRVYAQNDSRVLRIIQEGEDYLASALTSLSVVLDPQLIILGGGGMDGGLYDAEKINDLLQDRLPEANKGKTLVTQAKAGNQAGVLGAIIQAETNLKS